MVDLMAAGMKRALASRKSAEQVGGKAETHRKHFRELEQKRELPPPSGSIASRARALVEAYRREDSFVEEARGALPLAEKRAGLLELDLNQDLEALYVGLRGRSDQLLDFLSSGVDQQKRHFRAQGVNDPTKAAARLEAKYSERELLERQLEALRQVRHLRGIVLSADLILPNSGPQVGEKPE